MRQFDEVDQRCEPASMRREGADPVVTSLLVLTLDPVVIRLFVLTLDPVVIPLRVLILVSAAWPGA